VLYAEAALFAFALAAALTPVVRAAARRFGAVAQPNSDRWHKKPTAMLGGIAIFLATIITAIVFGPRSPSTYEVLATSALLFVVGLVDDFRHLKPYQKLIGQLVGAIFILLCGLLLPWTAFAATNMLVTLLWLIGITNAINMLDNMDGLAAGVATIAAICLAVNFHLNDQPFETAMLCGFAGALLGFLLYNFNPASIFMGDSGSMFVGFFLGSAALLSAKGASGRSRSLLPALAVPVMILLLPIADTTLVTLMRKLSGRRASQGGRDHTSHRLVALGMSERKAVLMLWAVAAASGVLGVGVRRIDIDVSIAIIVVFGIALTLVGIYLAEVRVYDPSTLPAASSRPVVSWLVDLSYKRRIFEVLLDVVLIVLAYYGGYRLVFGPYSNKGDWLLFATTLPLVLLVKLSALALSGIYRGLWKYLSVDSVLVFIRGVAIASVATVVALLGLFRFQGFSRTAFLIDGILLLLFIITSRFAFRVLRALLPATGTATGERTLIFGAGDRGELLLRELTNTRGAGVAVAFLDDDKLKVGRILHGLPVFDASRLVALCADQNIEQVVISSTSVDGARIMELEAACREAGVALKLLSIRIEPLFTPGDVEAFREKRR